MSNRKENFKNRLSNEKSPYLLQHAGNPVAWYPWGNEAFNKAREEDKPVFLSIGYSTCHWCHVMEHESFEDEETAKLLNDAFVCVKVDREERPDIDNIYMTVCQILTGSGGWPLTIVMTPDKRPFFAGTYIPKENKWGRTGLLDLIPKIKKIWTESRNDVHKSAEEIIYLINKYAIGTTGDSGKLDEDVLKKAYNYLKANYDKKHGGFSGAPKFPSPHNLLFLLRYQLRFNETDALDMILNTLKKMRMGGIFDHVGFGFHRYSTDPMWLVPHFEKMLYDQALLAFAYTEAYQASKDNFFAKTACEILDYVLRDMTSPEGAFYSAEDADSEGVEGKFYLWKQNEIESLLNLEDKILAIKIFNINSEGNFHVEFGQEKGSNILYIKNDINKIAEETGLPVKELAERIEVIRKKLFLERAKRIHPHKDDKILTDWNGLMIAALATAGRALDSPEYTNAAIKAAGFIRQNLLQSGNRLLHRYREGEAAITGNLDDYAFFTWGLIELYHTTQNAEYLKQAIEVKESMMLHFTDENNESFYFTPNDGEDQIVRTKIFFDSAVPSGNSIAFYNLIRLSRITGDSRWEDRANKLSLYASSGINQSPAGHTMFLAGLDMAMNESLDIVIAGDSNDNAVKEMLSVINGQYLPDITVIVHPAEDKSLIAELAQHIKSQTKINGKATAYVCRNFSCSQPTNDIQKMLKLLVDKKEATI